MGAWHLTSAGEQPGLWVCGVGGLGGLLTMMLLLGLTSHRGVGSEDAPKVFSAGGAFWALGEGGRALTGQLLLEGGVPAAQYICGGGEVAVGSVGFQRRRNNRGVGQGWGVGPGRLAHLEA